MVSFTKHSNVVTSSYVSLRAVYRKWKFESVEEFFKDKPCHSLVLQDGKWYHSSYSDTEFHIEEWKLSLEYLRDATPNEVSLNGYFNDMFELMRD